MCFEYEMSSVGFASFKKETNTNQQSKIKYKQTVFCLLFFCCLTSTFLRLQITTFDRFENHSNMCALFEAYRVFQNFDRVKKINKKKKTQSGLFFLGTDQSILANEQLVAFVHPVMQYCDPLVPKPVRIME